MTIRVDDYGPQEFIAKAAAFGLERYGYVVTPNVDHIIRYCDDPEFKAICADAAFVLLDSRFLGHWLALIRRQYVRVCPGSDLTEMLLRTAVQADDRVVLVGATSDQARQLVREFTLRRLVHIEPPMGFIHNVDDLEDCLQAIEAASPFRYCFLAVGSPQQEIVAHRLMRRDTAQGLALCVGASINFLTGVERRAPPWLRRLGGEWIFRVLQNPRSLARRYLIRGPRIFYLMPKIRIIPRGQLAGR